MKAYWINATEQTVTEVDSTGLSDLQRLVGGYIEVAKSWHNGDILFADEEGLLKSERVFFRIAGNERPIAGNGVVVGAEDDETEETAAPSITLDELRAEVTFLSAAQVSSWAKGNSSEPAVVVHFEGSDPNVVARMGDLFGEGPPKTKG